MYVKFNENDQYAVTLGQNWSTIADFIMGGIP